MDATGAKHPADVALAASPSVLFDAVAVLAGPDGDAELTKNPDAIGFLMDACRHLKVIAIAGVPTLSQKTAVDGVTGVLPIGNPKDIAGYIKLARNGKVWERPED